MVFNSRFTFLCFSEDISTFVSLSEFFIISKANLVHSEVSSLIKTDLGNSLKEIKFKLLEISPTVAKNSPVTEVGTL